MSGFKVATTAETFWALYHRVRSGDPFVYTRYGDGEMNIMLRDGTGAAGQAPNDALAKDTQALFQLHDSRNMLGLAMHQPEPHMTRELFLGWDDPRYHTFRHQHQFENAIALHYYSVFKPHLLRMLFDLVRDRRKALVTSLPVHLGPAAEMLLGNYEVIRVPETNAHDTLDEWCRPLESHDLVVHAIGAAKCAMALRFLQGGWDVQSLDLGSLLDFACGIPSRSWITTASPEARKVLLGG